MESNVENNKLFGAFLGWQPTHSQAELIGGGTSNYWYTNEVYIPYKEAGLILPELFEFDSNWNWLMAVVEKIESLGYYLNWFGHSDYVAIGTGIDGTTVLTLRGKENGFSKIETIYQAVLKFINWYNTQK